MNVTTKSHSRRTRRHQFLVMRRTMCIPLLATVVIGAGCVTADKANLDAEVRRLCAIDGGTAIYETVKLPREAFNQWGQINFYRPTRNEEALGADYTFKDTVQYYKKGNPDSNTGESVLARRHYRVFRKADGKLLGESVLYLRRGGDVPGPWHPSSFSCPT